jgi:uncharacterized protein RhaS with RHS repeats
MGLVTQQDPIGIAGGLNLYGYANGDPINFSDPFGLCPVCLVGVGVARAVVPFVFSRLGGAALSAGATAAAVGIAAQSSDDGGGTIFHRRTAAYPNEIDQVLQSGEVWGRRRSNIFGGGLDPQVKAYEGPLPQGTPGYEFSTGVPQDPGTAPGNATWTGPRPGVNEIDDETVAIKVEILRIQRD